jgi:hypothetical protein
MPEITVRHEFACDEDTFWDQCVFNETFNRKLYIEILKFPAYETMLQTDEPGHRTRKVRIEPPLGNMPGPVKKLIGDRLGYVEEGTFDKKTKRYTFRITPTTLADKTTVAGELYCEILGDKKIARVAKINVAVKMFAVGGLVEDKIASDLRASYEAAAKFTNAFVKGEA